MRKFLTSSGACKEKEVRSYGKLGTGPEHDLGLNPTRYVTLLRSGLLVPPRQLWFVIVQSDGESKEKAQPY
jgi:hypothetical protein